MRISDWSSDVCSSDLRRAGPRRAPPSPRRVGPRRGARPHERRLPPHHAFHHPTGRPQMIHALRHGARRAMLIASASMIALTFAVPAHAGGSSMPWEAPLQSILESIEGPVAKIVAVIIII